MSKSLIVHPYGGLGNRLRMLASVLRLSNEQGVKCCIVWERNSSLSCSYSKLFQNDEQVYSIKEIRIHEKIPKAVYSILKRLGYPCLLDFDMRSGMFAAMFKTLISKKLPPIIHSCYPDNISALQKIREYFKPSLAVCSIVDSYVEKIGGPYVGIHVRRGDNQNAKHHSSLELFVEEINGIIKADSNLKFYLSTDDASVESELLSVFGEKVLFVRKKNLERSSDDGVVDALIDMLILSRGEWVVGSYYSSFSEVSAAIGNVPLKILAKEI